jgi:hypothetical protein
MDEMQKALEGVISDISKAVPGSSTHAGGGLPAARGSIAREFRRQAVAEAVIAAGQSIGRRIVEQHPDRAAQAAWASSAAGIAAGKLARNEEVNQAVHYLAAAISQTIRALRRA